MLAWKPVKRALEFLEGFMDTNLVSALAEALKQMPVQKTGISDATWQILFNGIIAIALAWIGWKSHSSAKTSAENSETVKRIEKDVNSKSAVLAVEKTATIEKVIELSKENAALKEQVRSFIPSAIPATIQSVVPNVPTIPLPLPITIVTEEGK